MRRFRAAVTGLVYLILLIFPVAVAAQEGKKYGLFVGVSDYQKQSKSLPASVRDATAMRDVLAEKFGFGGEGGTRLLIDGQATRENIINAIDDFRKIARKGDLFVFYFSGHGTLFPDKFSKTPDEEIKIIVSRNSQLKLKSGNYDSAIVPYNSDEAGKRQWRGLILDDELFELFEGFTSKEVRVVFISDSCNSGTLAKSFSGFDSPQPENKPKVITKSLGWREAIGIGDETKLEENTSPNSVSKPNLNGFYMMIGSSEDNEVSVPINPVTGDKMSLFTYYFLEKLNEYQKTGKKFTFETVLKEISPTVKGLAREQYDFSQTPRVDDRFYKGRLDVPVF